MELILIPLFVVYLGFPVFLVLASGSPENEPRMYFDQNGYKVKTEEEAWSYVDTVGSERYRFYASEMVARRNWCFQSIVKKTWYFHHESTSFGSWMWPEGIPLRFDDQRNVLDSNQICDEHAKKLGSDWVPSIDGYKHYLTKPNIIIM